MTDASPCGHIDRQVKLVPIDLLWQIQKAKTQAHSAWLLLAMKRKEAQERRPSMGALIDSAFEQARWATQTLDALEYQIRTGNTLHEKD